MKRSAIVSIVFLFLTSCHNQNGSVKPDASVVTSVTEKKNPALADFLSKFKVLPHETLKLNFVGYDTTLTKLNAVGADTLFIPNCAMGLAYGMLPDTSKFYVLLWYAAVENGALEITTLDKNGKRMDEKQPGTGLYGWGCGYLWSGKVFIRKDMTILSRDSIVSFVCDSVPTPESEWKHELDSMDGTINAYGKITFSKVRQTKLD